MREGNVPRSTSHVSLITFTRIPRTSSPTPSPGSTARTRRCWGSNDRSGRCSRRRPWPTGILRAISRSIAAGSGSAMARTSMPPMKARSLPYSRLSSTTSMPAFTSSGCRQSSPASSRSGISTLHVAAGVQDHLHAAAVEEVEQAPVGRLDELAVDARGEERRVAVAHVVVQERRVEAIPLAPSRSSPSR